MAILGETKIGNAYPDIVFVEYNPDNYADWNNYRTLLDTKDYKVLFHLYTMTHKDKAVFNSC